MWFDRGTKVSDEHTHAQAQAHTRTHTPIHTRTHTRRHPLTYGPNKDIRTGDLFSIFLIEVIRTLWLVTDREICREREKEREFSFYGER